MEAYDYLFTLEDGIIQGGFGEKVFAALALAGKAIKGEIFGFESGLVPHGKVSALFEREKLNAQGITERILEDLK